MVAVSGCDALARTLDGKEIEFSLTPAAANCGYVPNAQPRTLPCADTLRFGPGQDGSIQLSGTVKRDSTRRDTIVATLKPVQVEEMPMYDRRWWWTRKER